MSAAHDRDRARLLTYRQACLDADKARMDPQVAGLLQSALPEYYAAIPRPVEDLVGIVAAQFEVGGTECSDPTVLLREGEVIAAAIWFPCSELKARQSAGTAAIARLLTREERALFLSRLSSRARSVEPIEPSAEPYIARIAVSRDHRRQGNAERLIEHIAARSGICGLHLHVAAHNEPAISFYRKNGFAFATADKRHETRAMHRPAPASTAD